MSLPTEDTQKQDRIGEVALATTSNTEPDVFSDIDKRLSMLLARANRLESTLNRLNNERADSDTDLDPDLISSGDADNEYSFEVDDLDLDAEDDDNDASDVADDFDKINLDAHED